MTEIAFHSLGLTEPILRALEARDYTTPTPIQARTIPHLLQGRDLLGIAQTGTGKTAAFALPMIQILSASNRRPQPQKPRALVLAPTRELANQIADSFDAYGKNLRLTTAVIFGGVGQNPQVQALRRGIDVLVATPGRLLDLMQQRHCDLSAVEILVLDEADRMLDMGFLPDVKRILSRLPAHRQSLLFSATMPQDITSLADKLLKNPLRVEVTPPAATADRVEQSIYFVEKNEKRFLLADLLADPVFERTLVFTRTKHGADRVVKHLHSVDIHAHAIHGNKSQNARERALEDFRSGKAPVLVATDIAARGIDVRDISHVVNFDLPNIPESYVHRIGRTARAGRDGIAISFCDREEREFLRDIEKLIRQRIPVAAQAAPRAKKPEAPAERPAREPKPAHHKLEPQLVATAPDRRPQRQRPEPRQTPGPYVPAPEPRRAHHPKVDTPRRDHKHRPAAPNAVDPEQRRPRPRPQPHSQPAHRPHTEGRHTGGQHSGGQHSGGQHSGGQHTGGQHSSGQRPHGRRRR